LGKGKKNEKKTNYNKEFWFKAKRGKKGEEITGGAGAFSSPTKKCKKGGRGKGVKRQKNPRSPNLTYLRQKSWLARGGRGDSRGQRFSGGTGVNVPTGVSLPGGEGKDGKN